MKDVITKEALVRSPIEKVWSAISKSEEISKWFLSADFEVKIGYAYTFKSHTDHCSPIIGTVKNADPYTLAYTWVVEGTDVETLVEWKLTSVGESTQINLTHSGISNYGQANAVEMFNSFNGGWDNCLNGLSAHFITAEHEA